MSTRERDPYLRRNWWLNVADGSFFIFALAFVEINTILPALIERLGGGAIAIAALPVLGLTLNGIAPLAVARGIERMDSKRPAVLLFGLLMRLPWLALAVLCPLIAVGYPDLMLVSLLVGVALVFGFGGMVFPAWLDYVTNMTPESMRGGMFSARVVIGQGLGILGGVITATILAQVAFPWSYTLLFSLTFIVMMLSYAALLPLREPPRPEHAQKPSARPRSTDSWYRTFWKVVKQRPDFARFLIARGGITYTMYGTGLCTAFALREFGLDDKWAGIYAVVFTVGMIVISPVLGRIGDRRGHKLPIVIAQASAVPVGMVALFAPDPYSFGAVFAFAAIQFACQLVNMFPITVEFADDHERPTVIALSQLVIVPAGACTMGMSALVDATGDYTPLFISMIVVGVLGAWYSWAAMRDPRGPSQAFAQPVE